jgi:peptidyl-prolyl cis-trans isomerase C
MPLGVRLSLAVLALALGGLPAAALAAPAGSGPAPAKRASRGRQQLDRVVAVVGDDIVLGSELRRTTERHPLLQEALAQLPRNASAGTIEEKRRDVEAKVLDELIDIVLLRNEAQKFDIKITEKDVDRATEDIARQYGMTVADLRRQVEESVEYGSWADYRDEVRDQILQYKVPHYLATWSVSEAQVREHYRKMTKDESAKVEVHQYVFNPPSQGSADRDRAFAAAQAVSRRLRNGEEPGKLAEELGKAASERTIGRGDVAPALEDALFAAKEKNVVGPLASGQGYVVFIVDQHLESAALSYEEAKDRIREQLEQEAFFKAQAEMRQQLRAKAHIDIRL